MEAILESHKNVLRSIPHMCYITSQIRGTDLKFLYFELKKTYQ